MSHQHAEQNHVYQIGETAHVLSGHDFILHCNAFGHPTPSYYWNVLSQKASNNVKWNGNTLTITNVQTSNENKYRCTAKNSNGTIRQTSELRVYGKILCLFVMLFCLYLEQFMLCVQLLLCYKANGIDFLNANN